MTYGVVCRVLLYSSLALSTRNAITLELSTPAAAAPHGVALCATDPRFSFTRGEAAVSSLLEGGDLWSLSGAEAVPQGASDWRSGAWFQGAAAWGLQAVEVASGGALLRADPYYDASFAGKRCARDVQRVACSL